MGKLRLHVDDLRVDAFVTARDAAYRGTVQGRSDTLLFCYTFEETCWNRGCNTGISAPDYCQTAEGETCNGWAGCGATSEGGQGNTCEGTCSDYGCTVCAAWC